LTNNTTATTLPKPARTKLICRLRNRALQILSKG